MIVGRVHQHFHSVMPYHARSRLATHVLERSVARVAEPHDNKKIRSVAHRPAVVEVLGSASLYGVVILREVERALEPELFHARETIAQYLGDELHECGVCHSLRRRESRHWRGDVRRARAALEELQGGECGALWKEGEEVRECERVHFEGAERDTVLVRVEVAQRLKSKAPLQKSVEGVEPHILQHFHRRHVDAARERTVERYPAAILAIVIFGVERKSSADGKFIFSIVYEGVRTQACREALEIDKRLCGR